MGSCVLRTTYSACSHGANWLARFFIQRLKEGVWKAMEYFLLSFGFGFVGYSDNIPKLYITHHHHHHHIHSLPFPKKGTVIVVESPFQ